MSNMAQPISDDLNVDDDVPQPAESGDEAGDESAPILGDNALTKESLASAVHMRFQRRFRESIAVDDIVAAMDGLDLGEAQARTSTPQLKVERLRLEGEKRLHDQPEPLPFVYDQAFSLGVNVLLIEDNGVGKSSLAKSIKYALTGDDSDYDKDVSSWITDVWLAFSLAGNPYTIILSRKVGAERAILVPGKETRPLDEAAESTSAIFDAHGPNEIKSELQHFFFNHLGLSQLSWVQEQPAGQSGDIAERRTSWLTYYQALHIPDDGDRYLLCDAQHSYGNQPGLILSAFLGLSFANPLNTLGVELSRTRKGAQREKLLSAQEKQEAEEQIRSLETRLQDSRSKRDAIVKAQRLRRQAVEESESNRHLLDMQRAFEEARVELQALETSREEAGRNIQQDRDQARRLRQAVALQLHFTGINVTLCPSCDTPVDESSITQERDTHICRLCGKSAHAAPADEINRMKIEADACEKRCQTAERERDAMSRRMSQLRGVLERLEQQISETQRAVAQGVAYAFPTPEEDAERESILQDIGVIQRDLTIARERLKGREPEIKRLELHQKIVDRIREVLKTEAARRDAAKLTHLGDLTQTIAHDIGAQSITNLTCSPLGKVQLSKHSEVVSFSSIRNEGERLRVKLAFFLAMMRLSRDTRGGHHPGFLIVDQPGASEMVSEDFVALAHALRQIDQESGKDIQILCFTARPQFAVATDSSRVYGAQADRYAF